MAIALTEDLALQKAAAHSSSKSPITNYNFISGNLAGARGIPLMKTNREP
jgi:hypothetical protein